MWSRVCKYLHVHVLHILVIPSTPTHVWAENKHMCTCTCTCPYSDTVQYTYMYIHVHTFTQFVCTICVHTLKQYIIPNWDQWQRCVLTEWPAFRRIHPQDILSLHGEVRPTWGYGGVRCVHEQSWHIMYYTQHVRRGREKKKKGNEQALTIYNSLKGLSMLIHVLQCTSRWRALCYLL